MNYIKAQNFCLQAIKAGVILTLFTPLLVTSSLLFPYVSSKAIVFQVLVEIMLVLYLWLLYFNYKQTGSHQYLPKLNLLSWTLIAFFIVLTLNAIFSVDPSNSFWSKQERMDGLFNLAHFFVFFFILAGVLKTSSEWRFILNFSLIASILVSFNALGQKLGWFFAPYGQRITGPLGNASFLATYVLFNIFFALLLTCRTKKIGGKIYYGAILFLEIIILFLTYTRGAIFGLLAGALIFLIGYAFLGPAGRNKRYALGLLILVFLAGAALFSFRHTDLVKRNSLLNRLTDISFSTGTGKTRLISWQIGFKAFLAKPLFGWGEENYYFAFHKNLDPIFYSFSTETFDRAHNKMVDLLVMNGLFGFLAYLFVFLFAFLGLWSIRKKDFIAGLTLVALLAAYFVQNFFLFDMPVSYLMFFFFLGLVNVETETKNPPTPKQRKVLPKTVRWLKYSAWLGVVFVLFFLWVGNLKPILASQDSIDFQKYLSGPTKNDKSLQTALEEYKKSIDYQSFANIETRKIFGQNVSDIISRQEYSNTAKTEAVKFAISELQQGIKEHPLFIDYYLSLGNIYNSLGTNDPIYLAEGKKILEQAIVIYPSVPQLYNTLIVNRLLAQDLNQSRNLCEKVIGLNPNLPVGHWYLGIVYFYAGDFNAAKQNTEKAMTLGYDVNNNIGLNYLSQLYGQLNDKEKSIKFAEDLVKLNPQDPQSRFGLAEIYQKFGQKQKARELAEQLLKEFPQNATTIKAFLEKVK